MDYFIGSQSRASGAEASRELLNGQPCLGARGPEGSSFLGWVLVQVWEPNGGLSGVTINGTGSTEVLRRAAEALSDAAARVAKASG